MAAKKAPAIAVGARVAYSAGFLRSAGLRDAKSAGMRGTVRALNDLGVAGFVLAEIEWDDGRRFSVNTGNLVETRRIAADAALEG